MTGKWKLRGIVTALVMLALVCVPMAGKAMAANLELDDQAGQLGNQVAFTVSINNAPNQVAAFGFDVTYNSDVLSYVGFERGDLVPVDPDPDKKFDYFNVNLIEPGLLRCGGFEAGADKIATGASGTVVKLTFNVIATADKLFELTLIELKDHISGWTIKDGAFAYLLPAVTGVSPVKGPTTGGQTVTITGTNFFEMTVVEINPVIPPTVNFDAVEATEVVVVSATQITCKTPPNAEGKVDVVVTNPDTKAATLTDGYEYLEFGIDPSSKTLKVGESQEFTVMPEEAGTAPFTWKVDDEVKQTGDSRTYTFTAAAAVDYIITVEDSSIPTPLSASAAVDVYEDVAIPETPEGYDPEDPITYPTVQSDDSYDFTVTGGDDEALSYTWTVDGPVAVDDGAGASFAFEAPIEGAFAGVYTVTVTDSVSEFTKSIKVKVPMTFTPKSMNMEGDPAEPVAGPNKLYTFVVAGAPVGTEASIALVTKYEVAIEEPEEYGTPTIEAPFDADAKANVIFDTAAVDAAKSFLFEVTATDTDLDAAVLNVLYSGRMSIIPMTQFTGVVVEKVVDEETVAIPGADIRVMLGEDEVIPQKASGVAGYFTFTVVSPSTIGEEYTVIVNKDGYVTESTTTEGWENPRTIPMAAEVASLSGTVKDYGGTPIDGARILAELEEKTIEAYSDADGYTLSLLVALPEELMARATKDGYLADRRDVIADANFVLVQMTRITTVTTKVGDDVEIKITADPSFDGTPGEISAELEVVEGAPNGLGLYDPADNSYTWTEAAPAADFTLNIQADTTEDKDATAGYFAGASVKWVVAEAKAEEAKIQPVTEKDGGSVEAEGVTVDVPPGALDADGKVKIVPDIDVGDPTAKTYTEKSTVLVSIDIIGATLLNPIRITIPFDTDAVEPGDFKAGKAVIYHAETAYDLRKGKDVEPVPPSDILYQDDINGLVCFKVDHLTVYGVGSPAPAPTAAEEDDDNCFIATAAYGSPLETHVETLRHFRDVYLMPTKVGHAFVEAYYEYSPPAADFIAGHDTLRAATRVALMPVVGMSYVALHTSPAQKTLILVLMIGLIAAGYMGTRRMRIIRQ